MMRISVLFVIVIIIVTISSLCVVMGLYGGVGSELLGVDVLEEAAILHGVIGFGIKLAGTLQGLAVVILLITTTIWLLNRVDFMIILAGMLASVVVVAVAPLIPIVSVVAVVVALITMIEVVISTTVIAVVVTVRWVFGA
jgi:hypothetical protein